MKKDIIKKVKKAARSIAYNSVGRSIPAYIHEPRVPSSLKINK